MNWLKKILSLDKQEEKIEELITISSQLIGKREILDISFQNNSKKIEQTLEDYKELDKVRDNKFEETIKIAQKLIKNNDQANIETIKNYKSINEKLEFSIKGFKENSFTQEQKLSNIEIEVAKISKEVIPESFNPNYELVDPLDTSIKLFSFNTVKEVSSIKKNKIDTNTKSFLRVFASSIPKLTSNVLLANSYRFVFPQGMSGDVMKMASGQGTAIMQGGKILTHGSYVLNMAVAAPLMAVSISSIIIRQHYLAKINANLDEINQMVSQLLELEFIKKQSQIESIIYFLEKAHNDFRIIEHNKEYRNAILTNLVRTNIEIFELIQFYKKSLKFIDNKNSKPNELNLKYYIVLHQLFYQGKLLEFKYANEYNKMLIGNLRSSIIDLVKNANKFLKENIKEIDIQISKVNISFLDWFLNKKQKKEKESLDYKKTKSIVDQIIEIQNIEAKKITLELTEFQNNIIQKKEFFIENGELFEVLD